MNDINEKISYMRNNLPDSIRLFLQMFDEDYRTDYTSNKIAEDLNDTEATNHRYFDDETLKKIERRFQRWPLVSYIKRVDYKVDDIFHLISADVLPLGIMNISYSNKLFYSLDIYFMKNIIEKNVFQVGIKNNEFRFSSIEYRNPLSFKEPMLLSCNGKIHEDITSLEWWFEHEVLNRIGVAMLDILKGLKRTNNPTELYENMKRMSKGFDGICEPPMSFISFWSMGQDFHHNEEQE